ncbi:helix-turn-helix domain-containing protein [Actinoplanes sp. NPDC049596]|uniref:winged helix-turn-helix transcriptional regulator n=1 Tax=unclassified Actinoplanes TaxID=2626549 RepID=UPI00343795F1
MTDIRRDPATLPGRPCSVAAALELVGDRWALLAVREISFGNNRFSQIARNTGAPRDRLAARLKALTEAGIVEKSDGYHLTEAGRDLFPVIWSLLAWGDRWAVTEPPVRFEHRHDHEFHPTTVCAECGERPAPGDLSRSMRTPGWTMTGPAAAQ